MLIRPQQCVAGADKPPFHILQIYSQLYRLLLLGRGDIDSLSTRLLFPPLRDGDRLSRRIALRGGVTERDIDLVMLRPLCLSLPILLGGVRDIDRDLGGSLARVERPILERESDRDLERLERPKLDRDLERLERLSLGLEIDRDGERNLDRDLDLDNEGLRPRFGDLE